ncbi:MAG: hypothetical protein K6G36_02225 [Candidatus Saccharibacteria bacterium]|nr:hypothetical protein [Candidatus Saccharibacteria bacterium]
MKKYEIKKWLKKLRPLKNWQLFLILVPLLFVSVELLRRDHIKMVELRDAVLAADEEENTAEITERLEALRDYTFSNVVINIVDDNGNQRITFGTGPFYLEHMYIRAALTALSEAESSFDSDSNPNGNIYSAASAVCQPQAVRNGWAWNNPNFINCMIGEISKYPSMDEEIKDNLIAKIPSTELYRYNFASPIWAPTLTGFILLLDLIIIVVIFIRIFVWIFLKIAIRFV